MMGFLCLGSFDAVGKTWEASPRGRNLIKYYSAFFAKNQDKKGKNTPMRLIFPVPRRAAWKQVVILAQKKGFPLENAPFSW